MRQQGLQIIMVKVVPYPEKPGTLGFGGSSLIFRDTQVLLVGINTNPKGETQKANEILRPK